MKFHNTYHTFISRGWILILGALLLVGCHGDPPVVGRPQSDKNNLDEHMINANRTIAQSEATAIDEYVSRRGWPVNKLSEGERVWVYQKGSGAKVEMEDTVTLNFNVESINGKVIYDYEEETYVAGHRRDLIGLDAAVIGMTRGSKAKVILPSNLAYGIGGD